MQGQALLDALVALAQEAGMRVRVLPRSAGEDPPPLTGACRVRGEIWLLLAPQDPLEDRIDAVANALREHAEPVLQGRWLPPAVRERLERGS